MVGYFRPDTLDEAVALLSGRPDLCVLAGATDVYPAKTQRAGWGHMSHADILDISGIARLRGIEDRGTHWWIGATTTWSDIVAAALPPILDGLKAAAREIGGIQIQNRGTIAGNICTASPAGDSIPCLLALDAEVEVLWSRAEAQIADGSPSQVPMASFFTGYRKTVVSGGAGLVTGIRIPKQQGHGAFLKLGARRYLVISITMVSGVFDVAADGTVRSARIAVGACSAVAQRLPALEAELIGKRPEAALIGAEHLAHLSPIDDVRASAAYRRAAALQLVRDLIAGIAQRDRRAA